MGFAADITDNWHAALAALAWQHDLGVDEVVQDANGQVTELRCSIDHDTLGKNPQGRKAKGVIHCLSVSHARPAEIRLYHRLFTDPEPDGHKDRDFLAFINPDSLTVTQGWVEPAAAQAQGEDRYQFERLGYFCADRFDHQPGTRPVFNRTVGLKDTWTK